MVLSALFNHKVWRAKMHISKVRASKAACYTCMLEKKTINESELLLALPGGKVFGW